MNVCFDYDVKFAGKRDWSVVSLSAAG